MAKKSKMVSIRIPEDMIEELRIHLQMEGAYLEGLSETEMVRRGLSLLLFGKADGLVDKERGLDHIRKRYTSTATHVVRGRIEEWAKTIDWADPQVKERYPKEVLSILTNIVGARTNYYPIKEGGSLYRETPLEVPKPERSKTPPWENLPFIPREELVKKYPRHSIFTWGMDDKLKIKAYERAFEMVPHKEHKREMLTTTAKELYRIFREWEEGE